MSDNPTRIFIGTDGVGVPVTEEEASALRSPAPNYLQRRVLDYAKEMGLKSSGRIIVGNDGPYCLNISIVEQEDKTLTNYTVIKSENVMKWEFDKERTDAPNGVYISTEHEGDYHLEYEENASKVNSIRVYADYDKNGNLKGAKANLVRRTFFSPVEPNTNPDQVLTRYADMKEGMLVVGPYLDNNSEVHELPFAEVSMVLQDNSILFRLREHEPNGLAFWSHYYPTKHKNIDVVLDELLEEFSPETSSIVVRG